MENEKLSVSVGFYLMLALMLLLMPLRWLFSAIVAALFHECCHYAVIRLLCRYAGTVKIYSYGARMPLPEMSRSKEILCALAGPAGGLLLTIFAPIFPKLAVCAFLQSVYNLLPIYPLDGGRMISALLSMLFSPPKAAAIMRITEICTKTGICLAGLYGCFCLHLGVLPLFIAALVCIRIK
jgi:stage IV sporulation protein FB